MIGINRYQMLDARFYIPVVLTPNLAIFVIEGNLIDNVQNQRILHELILNYYLPFPSPCYHRRLNLHDVSPQQN